MCNAAAYYGDWLCQAVKDTVMGTSDTAAEKAKEAEQQVRDTAAAAGQKGKAKVNQATGTANKVHMSASDIANEAQHAYDTQLGESAWQKVSVSSVAHCCPVEPIHCIQYR